MVRPSRGGWDRERESKCQTGVALTSLFKSRNKYKFPGDILHGRENLLRYAIATLPNGNGERDFIITFRYENRRQNPSHKFDYVK